MMYPITSLCYTGFEKLTITVDQEDFASLYILDDGQVSAATGYDDNLDELEWENWSDKSFEPLWFMQVLFECEGIYEEL